MSRVVAVTKLIPEGAFCLNFAELFSEEKSENAGLIFFGAHRLQ